MPSLAYKGLFYRPERNAKRGPHGIEFLKVLKWNIPMDRPQGVDEKMESFVYLSCLPLEL